MPRCSELQRLLAVAILEEENDEDLGFAHNHADTEFTAIDDLADLLLLGQSSRYLGQRTKISKSVDFKLSIFHQLPEDQFRLLTRTSRASFVRIASEIEAHRVFHNRCGYKQAPVWEQPAVTLDRLGSCGNGALIGRVQIQWGISRGTVNEYMVACSPRFLH